MVREAKMGGKRKRYDVQNLYPGSCPCPASGMVDNEMGF